jgi:hypothetical protein
MVREDEFLVRPFRALLEWVLPGKVREELPKEDIFFKMPFNRPALFDRSLEGIAYDGDGLRGGVDVLSYSVCDGEELSLTVASWQQV